MVTRARSLSLLLATIFAIAVQSPAFAQQSTTRIVTVHVNSVLAADTNEGIDPRLARMGPRLQALFSYSTYRLVSDQADKTLCGKMIVFQLPGGRILHVQPRQIDGDMIAMEIVLFQGPRPLMTTDLKLRNHGILIVGGPRYEQGMLIISIGASTAPPIKHAPAPVPAPAPPAASASASSAAQ